MFLRGAGSELSAAIGTLQLDAAPNIIGRIVITSGNNTPWRIGNSTSGAFYADPAANVQNINDGTGGASNGLSAAIFDASHSSQAYGRATEIHPRNYAIQYFIKY